MTNIFLIFILLLLIAITFFSEVKNDMDFRIEGKEVSALLFWDASKHQLYFRGDKVTPEIAQKIVEKLEEIDE